MRRSGPPERRTPLGRSTPLRQKSQDRARDSREELTYKPPKRGKPIQPRSAKRLAEKPERDAVRALVVERASYRCEAIERVPEVRCWSPERDGFGRPWLDVDEVVSRGVRPGGHLDPDNCQALCRAHHDWRTGNPEEARRRGLRRRSTDP